MKNHAFAEFWQLFNALPIPVQKQAREAFRIFKENPQHPSLRFKPLQGCANIYSVRINRNYRAVARRQGENLYWFWIGSHAEFDKAF